MSGNNIQIQKIEEALKTYKQWRFENAEVDFDVSFNIKKEEIRLDSLIYILAHSEGCIIHTVTNLMATHWQLPVCNLFKIFYEKRDEKLVVAIYRMYIQVIIKIMLEIDIEQGIVIVETINLFNP